MSTPPSSRDPDVETLQLGRDLRDLHWLVLVALALLVAFVGRQAWLQHSAVAASRPNVARLRTELARMEQIRQEFARFGSSHPAFVPILNKYGIAVPGQKAPLMQVNQP